MPTAAVDPKAMAPVQTTLTGSLFVDGARVGYTPTGSLAASTGGPADPTILTTATATDPLTGVPASGAVAGAPGVFVPRHALLPANLAGCPALTGQAAWGTTQYVVLRDKSLARWNGTAWVVYTPAAPPTPPALATSATAGSPGVWTPGGSVPPATIPSAPAPTPATAWTIGQHIHLNGGEQIYWNGTAWLRGKAP